MFCFTVCENEMRKTKEIPLQINSCKLSAGFLRNKTEQQEKEDEERRKEKELNQCFRIALEPRFRREKK